MMALTVIIFLVIEPYITAYTGLLVYAIFITTFAFICCGAAYFFDFRERKSIAPKKRKLVQRLTNKDIGDLSREDDLL